MVASKDVAKLFEGLRPWVTKFTIDGAAYGGDFDAMNDGRIEQFFQHFPEAKSILELGSLEGGHAFALSRRQGVQRVVGIEGRKTNVDKARCVQELLGIHNVEFVIGNLESYNLISAGTFDAVFCVGLLYHLPRPWDLIEGISQVSRNLFIWTHYAAEDKADKVVSGYRGITYGEFGLADPLSGMSPQSFWPTLAGLQTMLSRYGFTRTQIIEDNQVHPHGPSVTLAATAP